MQRSLQQYPREPPLIQIHSDQLKLTSVLEDCTLQEFCNTNNIPLDVSKPSLFVEVISYEDVDNIIDVILMNKVR